LLPTNGNGGVEPRAALASFNPSPELVDWAAEEHGINALADGVLGKFVDYQRANGRRPRDLDAAYRNWIRAEAKFTSADQSRRPAQGRRKRALISEAALAQIGRWGR
jgi:hypothetical protein